MRGVRRLVITIVACLFATTPVVAYAQTLTAVWDPNPSGDQVTSYQVCISTTPLSCNSQLATVSATATSYTFTPVAGVLYRVAVRAVSASGTGPYSSEVLVSVPSLAQPANQTSTVNLPIAALALSASDPDGGTLQFTHTGLPFGLSLNQTTGVITGTPASTGTFNVMVYVTDGLGSSSKSFVWTVQQASSDTTAPTVAITSHTSGQTVTSANITLSGTATDSAAGGSGITSVTVNGAAATSGTATGSNTANWSRTLTLTTGANTISVVARDGAGNARTSTITLNLSTSDTTAPSLAITSHSPGQTVSSSTITLSGTATDSGAGGNGVTSVTVNGSAATGGTATGSNTANWSRSLTLTPGANAISVVALDGVGNARSATITLTLASSDTAAPALTITSHTSGQTVTSATITLSGTATDNGSGGSGITSVTVNGAAATGGTAAGTTVANWSRSVTLSSGANVVTVVARDGAGNVRTVPITISYSAVAVVDAVSVSPSSGSGASQTFALQYSSNLGATNLSTAWVWFNATFSTSSTNSCLLYYDRQNATLYMLNDGSTWMSGTLGTVGALQNSQCAVSLAGSSATLSGNTLTLNLAMTFKSTYAGAKNIYMYAGNTSSVNSGWQDRGDWTVAGSVSTAAIVTADTATPSSGSGATQTFALNYSDSLGATDLSTAWVWFSGTFSVNSTNSCLLYYDRANATLYLLNDWNTWMPGTLGNVVTLQNSQCAVTLGASWVTLSGNTLSLHLTMTFKPGYAGTKNIYMYARNASNLISGWQDRGDWVVPGTGSAMAILTADSATPNSGSGATQTFALKYSDSLGVSDLRTTWVWFSDAFTLNATKSCLLYYDQSTAALYLLSDSETWMQGWIGYVGTLQNSQCAVTLGASSATVSGNTLTLSLAMTFRSGYGGTKNIYMYAGNAANANSGWQTRGMWTAP